MNRSVFRKKSLDRMESPEQMDDYIQATSPRLWPVLAAVAVLVTAVVVWSFTASLTSEVSLQAYLKNEHAVCYITPEMAKTLSVGMRIRAEGETGAIIEIGQNPLSRQEVATIIGNDYVFDTLDVPEWSVPVVISMPSSPDGIVEISVITGSVHPAEFVLN